jgi:hypothetical protein
MDVSKSETFYVQRRGIVARRVAGEVLLVPVAATAIDEAHRSAELFVLNPTGEYLWNELASPKRVPDLARNLMMSHEVALETALDDAARFVEALLGARLVQVTHAETDASR